MNNSTILPSFVMLLCCMAYFCSSELQCWQGVLGEGATETTQLKIVNCEDPQLKCCAWSQCTAVTEARTQERWTCRAYTTDETLCAEVAADILKGDKSISYQGEWSCTCIIGKYEESLPSQLEPPANALTTTTTTIKTTKTTTKKPSKTTKKSNGHRLIVERPMLALVVPMLIGLCGHYFIQ